MRQGWNRRQEKSDSLGDKSMDDDDKDHITMFSPIAMYSDTTMYSAIAVYKHIAIHPFLLSTYSLILFPFSMVYSIWIGMVYTCRQLRMQEAMACRLLPQPQRAWHALWQSLNIIYSIVYNMVWLPMSQLDYRCVEPKMALSHFGYR